ncbi:hypothetical protein K227x_08350 [Rubripirellula lacrimiformis]|uniref:Uncharacterized protein n=1 Tax=Rubripirellula lacrimiformis TaxID=1930273 RepID=A0A517N620_9BACT|nr:hypothetical protein [Rubripirellula lacrimiformis]QDT02458.1 hypothetical protein K227x_08350 [Rubripirellula lacrimiformis]
MRFSAHALALAALAIFANVSSAKNDFDALLADLSFGGTPSPSIAAPQDFSSAYDQGLSLSGPAGLSLAANDAMMELRPVPDGLTMPETGPAQARASLQDPIATVDPQAAKNAAERVDLNAAFALQEMNSPGKHVPTYAVGFGHQHGAAGCDGCGCASGACDQISSCGNGACGHASCGQGGCGMGHQAARPCVPRTAPNLPTSSLRQYFMSQKCNTNVWDGYQRPCPACHKHTHGTCDCFKNRNRFHSSILPPACGDCGGACQGGCDGGCDSVHAH